MKLKNINWEFWVDVGGTFTDVIACNSNGETKTLKLLSSGITKGTIKKGSTAEIINSVPAGITKENFWQNFQINFFNQNAESIFQTIIKKFQDQKIILEKPLPFTPDQTNSFELISPWPAPVLAIRMLLDLDPDDPIPDIKLLLGTTRGTNALLERKGAKTALCITKGFADLPEIGYQNRPELFNLNIQKPSSLHQGVMEIDERIDSHGVVLQELNIERTKAQLSKLKKQNYQSVAICLMHAWKNPEHENQIENLSLEVGFNEISISSKVSPLIKIITRTDTTILNAYLNPVLREYIHQIKTGLTKNSIIKLMTSNGGLAEADHFNGKESILSGPAGGVVGYANIAKQNQIQNVIGFDMGGTSTDVSRWSGKYEYSYETEKAGVRISTPAMAIETVAAGGGSICIFDGQKFTVGPESAGANPGPACYGRGGPLTITDINLILGRIVPQFFPFKLSKNAAELRLKEIQKQVEKKTGNSLSEIEIAEGFRQIANANMVAPIKTISIQRGFNPADHALITFGGAGAQHACAIADELDINTVIIPHHAGILSAVGIGLADIKHIERRQILETLTPESIDLAFEKFKDLEIISTRQLKENGADNNFQINTIKSFNLRYTGQENTIEISIDYKTEIKTLFEQEHKKLFGYLLTDRAIQIVSIQLEAIASKTNQKLESTKDQESTTHPKTTHPFWTGTKIEEVDVVQANSIEGKISGPAILLEKTSIIIIEQGWTAEESKDSGSIVLTKKPEANQSTPIEIDQLNYSDPNPIQLELFSNQLASIAEQMGTMLQRTSISTNVKERLDFSCAIFTPEGRLVVNAPHMPVHLGAMGETVRSVLQKNPIIKPGDVFLTNDPFSGGSHLPDLTVITPVVDSHTNKVLYTVANRAHHAEIGGIVPGSMPAFSKNLIEEGVIIQNFKLIDSGISKFDELKELLSSAAYPSRSIEENIADITAQVASNQIGINLINELITSNSLEYVQSYMQHLCNLSANAMRDEFKSIGNTNFSFRDSMDDGATIQISIQVKDERMVIDFSDTSPVLNSNLNATPAIVRAAILYCLRCIINKPIPLNEGVLEPVTIKLPQCFLNPPSEKDPAKNPAVAGGNVETSQRIVDTIFGALGTVAASQGTMNNFIFGDDSFGYYETIAGGSGAGKNFDGEGAVQTHMTNTRLTDPEIFELRYPARIHQFAIRKDSGGKGDHNGGNGMIREIEFLKSLKVTMLSERRTKQPYALNGAGAGKPGTNTLKKANGEIESLPGKFQIEVSPGDRLQIQTPGGGGAN